MTRHILAGLQRAARVTCDTAAVRVSGRSGTNCFRRIVRWCADRSGDGMQPGRRRARDREVEPLSPLRRLSGALARRQRHSPKADRRLIECAVSCERAFRLHLVRVGGDFTAEQRRLCVYSRDEGHVSVPPFGRSNAGRRLSTRDARTLAVRSRGIRVAGHRGSWCGTPVVASDLGGPEEVWRHGRGVLRRGDAVDDMDG